MNDIQISVIIPCYNCQDSLVDTINSIKTKFPNKIEIIVIDDCSTDNTKCILKSISKQYSNIVFIENELNRGAGETRNVGLDYSSGKFVMFLDSDDYLEPNCIDSLLETIDDSTDILLFGASILSSKKKQKLNLFYGNCIDFSSNRLPLVLVKGSVCGKLISNSLIKNNKIRFGNTKIAEDLLFMKKCIMHCSSIKYLDKTLYIYNINNPKSLMHSASKDCNNYELKAIESLYKSKYACHFQQELNSVFFIEVIYGYNLRVFFSKEKYKTKRNIFLTTLSHYNRQDKYYKLYFNKYRFIYRIMCLYYVAFRKDKGKDNENN